MLVVLQDPAERVALTAALSGLLRAGFSGSNGPIQRPGTYRQSLRLKPLNLDNMARCVQLPRQ
jgi:hypothetical protein